MLPLNKVELTAYRYSGFVGSCFTLTQSVIWFILSLAGAICKFTACGSNSSKNSFAYCFYLMYYYEPQNITSSLERDVDRINYVNPTSFSGIMWFNIFLAIFNFVISVITVKEFMAWKNARQIKIMAKVWPVWTFLVSFIELILCMVFIYDIVSIHWKEDEVKCFMKTNLDILRSSFTNEHHPAPYLLQLKSNLQTMKKKVKRMKKKLQFLNTIVDIENPDHLKNPFISERLATDYVEKIWKDMFNNDIRKTLLDETQIIPSDESLRNFVVGRNINFDKMDEDLIKNFDGLTNIKYVKPIKSSNLVFGKQFDLSPSITLETPSVTDDLANLLFGYIKKSDEKPANNTKFDQKFDDFFDDLIRKTKFGEETIHLHNTTKTIDIPKKNSFNEKNDNHTQFDSFLEELIESFQVKELLKSQKKINTTDIIQEQVKYRKFDENFDNFLEDLVKNLKAKEFHKFQDKINTTEKNKPSSFQDKPTNYTSFDEKFDALFEKLKFQNKTFDEKSANNTKFDQKFDDFFQDQLFVNIKDQIETTTFYENSANTKFDPNFNKNLDMLNKELFDAFKYRETHILQNKTNAKQKTETFHEEYENNTKYDFEDLIKKFKNLHKSQKINATDKNLATDKNMPLIVDETSANYTKFNKKFDHFFEEMFEKLKNGKVLKLHNKFDPTDKINKSDEKLENQTQFNKKIDDFFEDLFKQLQDGRTLKLPNKFEARKKTETLDDNSESYAKFNKKFDDFFKDLFEKLKDAKSRRLNDKFTKKDHITREKPKNYTKFDEKFDAFFRDLLQKFENDETLKSRLNISENNIIDEDDIVGYYDNNEESLSNLVDLISCILPKTENQTKNVHDSKLSLIKKIFDYSNKEFDDDEILDNLKQAVKMKYDLNKYDDDYFVGRGMATRNYNQEGVLINDLEKDKSALFSRNKGSANETELVKELCEYCSSFVLGPSILCMLMSLKCGLIWLLNIALAILTLYYDSLIEIRRKSFGFN